MTTPETSSVFNTPQTMDNRGKWHGWGM